MFLHLSLSRTDQPSSLWTCCVSVPELSRLQGLWHGQRRIHFQWRALPGAEDDGGQKPAGHGAAAGRWQDHHPRWQRRRRQGVLWGVLRSECSEVSIQVLSLRLKCGRNWQNTCNLPEFCPLTSLPVSSVDGWWVGLPQEDGGGRLTAAACVFITSLWALRLDGNHKQSLQAPELWGNLVFLLSMRWAQIQRRTGASEGSVGIWTWSTDYVL